LIEEPELKLELVTQYKNIESEYEEELPSDSYFIMIMPNTSCPEGDISSTIEMETSN
jgi:hypothetical protein